MMLELSIRLVHSCCNFYVLPFFLLVFFFLAVKSNAQRVFQYYVEDAVEKKWFILVACLWIAAELYFSYVVHFIMSPKIQPLRKAHAVHPTAMETIQLTRRCLSLVISLKNYSLEKYISIFFHCAPIEEIYCDNIKSFMAWILFNKSIKKLTKSERGSVEAFFEELHEKYEILRNLKPGYNPSVRHVAFTLEPVQFLHRPLFMYIAVGVLESMANAIMLRACGFHYLEKGGLTYWFRQGDPSEGDPMLFLHGISPGWALYMKFVHTLCGKRTTILVDLDAIKIKSLTFHMPSPDAFCANIMDVLERHAVKKVSVVGHSFGTITSGWFVTRYPHAVSHLTLIDPVSLLLALPDVAYKFLYRTPKTFMEWVIYLSASQEITVSHALRRNFWWYNNVLWLEDLPASIGVVVGMSGADDITNAQVLFEYVEMCRNKRRAAAALMKTSPSMDSLFGAGGNSLKRGNSVSRKLSSHTSFSTMAKYSNGVNLMRGIEGVLWPGYCHGQILAGGKHLHALSDLVRRNEKFNPY